MVVATTFSSGTDAESMEAVLNNAMAIIAILNFLIIFIDEFFLSRIYASANKFSDDFAYLV